MISISIQIIIIWYNEISLNNYYFFAQVRIFQLIKNENKIQPTFLYILFNCNTLVLYQVHSLVGTEIRILEL